MHLFLNRAEQVDYTTSQLNTFFPCRDQKQTLAGVEEVIDHAYERLEYCFSKISVKYYKKDGEVSFSPLMTDQYAVFLYFLSNTAAKQRGNMELADRLYALNKALHGLDVYHGVELPEIFLLVHTVGTVLGRARYDDYLVVYQGVTVGGNLELEYPEFGKGVGLFAGSMVIGKCRMGDNSMLAAKALLMDSDVDDGCVCFGTHPNNLSKQLRKSVVSRYFS